MIFEIILKYICFFVVVCFYYILQIIFKQVLWSVFSTQVRYYFIHIVLGFISVIRLDFDFLTVNILAIKYV